MLFWGVVARMFTSGAKKLWQLGRWSSSLGFAFGVDSASKWEAEGGFGYGSSSIQVRGTLTLDVAYVLACVDTVAANSFVCENGVDRTTLQVGGALNNITANGYIGKRTGTGENWIGAIAELGIAFDTTDQEVEQLEKYLKTFYGF